MKTFELPTGEIVLIDDRDYGLVDRYKWHMGQNGYVMRGKGVSLHRQIMGSNGDLQVDHKNKNRLDNRRGNLKWSTATDNCANRDMPRTVNHDIKSRGVTRKGNRFQASIKRNGKSTYLGLFTSESEASQAYQRAGGIA